MTTRTLTFPPSVRKDESVPNLFASRLGFGMRAGRISPNYP